MIYHNPNDLVAGKWFGKNEEKPEALVERKIYQLKHSQKGNIFENEIK